MTRELDTLLGSCIECALCLPHCATYLATGDETRSPRGRLMLLREVLDHPCDVDPSVYEAFDLCLGCRACETACPSGVPYALLDAAKGLADQALGPPDGPVIRQLSSRPALRLLRIVGGLARSSMSGLLGSNWRSRLSAGPASGPARQLGILPASPGNRRLIEKLDAVSGLVTARDAAPGRLPATGRAVAFFAGCANRELLPRTQERLLSLLEAAGVAVTVPEGQECCGALAAHTGDPHVARAQMARNVAALERAVTETGVLVAEAAGCGLELDTYPQPIAAAVEDATVFLAELRLPPLREVPLRVAYHDPCHARHGQGIVDAPRLLLKRIPGVEVLEPDEADVCCGSGGAYSLIHPELSAVMGRRKAGFLDATGADIVVTSNPGCLGQIGDALARCGARAIVLPLSDLLWYATLA